MTAKTFFRTYTITKTGQQVEIEYTAVPLEMPVGDDWLEVGIVRVKDVDGNEVKLRGRELERAYEHIMRRHEDVPPENDMRC